MLSGGNIIPGICMQSAARNFFLLQFFPQSMDAGSLFLRLSAGASLFAKHGLEKLLGFPGMGAHFPDPIHIGSMPSFVIALIADAICSVLVIAGLFTRWAALFAAANIFVAWSLVHHFEFFEKPQGDHGEVTVLYTLIFFAIFIAGPGRFSLDASIAKNSLKPVP